jgi:hypothetical protein
MKSLNKDEWLNDIPKIIYTLKKNYGFYYSGMRVKTTKDILEVINPKKHRHKIVLYQRGQRYFLVIYKKSGPDIYFTNEYVKDEKWNRMKYFQDKFYRAYKKAERDLENEMYRDEINHGL